MAPPGNRFRVSKVTPTVGAAGAHEPRGSTPGAGDTPPTAEDVHGLEGRELTRAELEQWGHLEWRGDERVVLHAGGMTFTLDLEPRG